jgi:coatomer subunit beta
MVMDILKVLTSQDIEVKRKAIGIALEMVSSRNVEDVVLFLKKQLQGTMESEFDKVSGHTGDLVFQLTEQNLEYRQLLIQSIHACAIKFSEVAANVVYVLMEFLGDSNNPSAVDVIAFVRYVVSPADPASGKADTCQRGGRKISKTPHCYYREASYYLQRDQVG